MTLNHLLAFHLGSWECRHNRLSRSGFFLVETSFVDDGTRVAHAAIKARLDGATSDTAGIDATLLGNFFGQGGQGTAAKTQRIRQEAVENTIRRVWVDILGGL